ncbi:MAG: hypothetical protein R3F21_20930 [Myxococcota bacterium]
MRATARLRRGAAATLGGVMAGHVLLETACDSLFLANVAVDRLPFVTIAIALLAIPVSRGRTGEGARIALMTLQLGAAIGTVGLAVLVGEGRSWVYYALPLWAGIATSLIVVRFWLVLGDLFTIVEGKRLFAGVAMGGAIGALLGSGIAALAAPFWGGQGLLFVSAAAFALSALGPALSLGSHRPARPRRMFGEETVAPDSLGAGVQSLVADAYAARIALLVLLGGITLTLGDYLFKSVLTTEIPAAELATWLSRIYLGLNLLSLGMLAVGVTPILRGLGVDRSLSVLPTMIAVAAIGTLAGFALASVIFLKLCDGTLRYSLHKTASELLYLPMSSRLRGAIKGAVDIAGQTLAKALASVLLLGLVLLPEPQAAVAVAALVSALIWVLSSLMLRRSYLDVFRRTLREGTIETEIEHPELDIDSVGSLIRALSDPDERHVVAAMRILSEQGHVDLIPSLILYHPRAEVVAPALDLFAATRRDDLELFLERLIDHEDAMVRAAAVRATWVVQPDIPRLEALRTNHCAVVRVSSVAGLLALGAAPESDYAAALEEALEYPSYEPRLAASIAARLRYHPVNRNALLRMASDPDAEVAREAVQAIAESADPWYTPALVALLGDRRIRDGVRRALLARGDAALAVLAKTLVDPSTPTSILRHVPRTVALFGSPEAARVLVDSLSQVESGMVRFKLLRGLETLVRGQRERKGLRRAALSLSIDRGRIRSEFERTLARSLDLLETEVVIAEGQRPTRRFASLGGELVVDLLRDKRALATGRLFMLLGLLHPGEDFRSIQEALEGENGKGHASAQELVETLLSRDEASQILRLVRGLQGSAVPDSSEPEVAAADDAYAAAIRSLLIDDSRSVRAVAMYHAGEVGIRLDEGSGDASVDERAGEEAAERADLRERALAALRNARGRGRRPSFDVVPTG